MITPEQCPLCTGEVIFHFAQDKKRDYWQCSHCALVFVDKTQQLAEKQEKEIYDLHENNLDDKGYRQFLSRLLEPLLSCLSESAKGLDFGCGPGPALAKMLKEKGFTINTYDKFYQPDINVLDEMYDFITATEVVEHLDQPGKELDQLWQHINIEGHLAVMTKRIIDRAAFAAWHYKNDPTHISFFSDETMHWLSKKWQADIVVMNKDVVIFKKLIVNA
jgi:2-polyprenyl-3-methyl-5-hydroxy-6-metoxy-1,4-benzoquinol methylase